ncbi:MAG TPA: hypothetical protein VFD36_18920 [Kofleriaceae bacterium]|nr:hypothetical protein [Kofleriaceae bacterium]
MPPTLLPSNQEDSAMHRKRIWISLLLPASLAVASYAIDDSSSTEARTVVDDPGDTAVDMPPCCGTKSTPPCPPDLGEASGQSVKDCGTPGTPPCPLTGPVANGGHVPKCGTDLTPPCPWRLLTGRAGFARTRDATWVRAASGDGGPNLAGRIRRRAPSRSVGDLRTSFFSTFCSERSMTIRHLGSGTHRAHRLPAETTRIVSRHVEYFRNHRHQMRYATWLRRGYPIGSGPTEGACKSVVTMRFKRSG